MTNGFQTYEIKLQSFFLVQYRLVIIYSSMIENTVLDPTSELSRHPRTL